MDLQTSLTRRLEDPALERNERAQLRCRTAKQLEEAGNYEAALEVMGELWRRIGDPPAIDGLNQATAAEVLLRSGVLTGWLGSAQQLNGAQETAKDLISRSLALFEILQRPEKVAEAQTELAVCYWREGAFDEARVVLREALGLIGEAHTELKATAILRSALIEKDANRLHDALAIIMDAAALLERSASHSLKGKFYGQLANLLEMLSAAEGREDYRDRALVEYAAASFHFEQAGHTRYSARVENNLAFLLLSARRFSEAHQHLDRARRFFLRLKDEGSAAQVDETRARTFLAEGRVREAERVAGAAVRVLERGGENALLAGALTTQATALARLGQHKQSQAMLKRALKVAQQAGAYTIAGGAALTLIEELSEHLSIEERRGLYERADELLAETQDARMLQRLRSAARRTLLVEHESVTVKEPDASIFAYGSEATARLLRDAHRIAATAQPVLITGESGTGKSLLARLIHQWSGRPGKFVEVNCATLDESSTGAQLFGHRRGSFSGATKDQPGAVREAAGGTLFLDKIDQLSVTNQPKLLRLIEHGEVHSVGAYEPERVDVRVVAAASRQLQEKVARKLFREDLFYRIQAFHLEIPPLRERPEDIPVLAERFIREATARHGERISFTAEAIAALKQLPLKGNAHELGLLIERMVLTAPHGTEITRGMIEILALRQTPSENPADPWGGCKLDEEVRLFEGKLIERALEEAGGQITRAARLLGVTHQCLAYILQGRQKELLQARTPIQRRRRSIIRTKT
jgi:DNA-binding NtrC family response regulator